ncbi:hypothetical protein B0H17DRAFT_1140991 [Mycena rosella]|uniref:Uncharacterized protein n=1 Tax=Mycena rosella TaxID=1033263 RepID=A0AAD7G9K2_MYCRO|nr:hypothetical protein B0H17DRAFT_1140991 [Mycena rosella]
MSAASSRRASAQGQGTGVERAGGARAVEQQTAAQSVESPHRSAHRQGTGRGAPPRAQGRRVHAEERREGNLWAVSSRQRCGDVHCRAPWGDGHATGRVRAAEGGWDARMEAHEGLLSVCSLSGRSLRARARNTLVDTEDPNRDREAEARAHATESHVGCPPPGRVTQDLPRPGACSGGWWLQAYLPGCAAFEGNVHHLLCQRARRQGAMPAVSVTGLTAMAQRWGTWQEETMYPGNSKRTEVGKRKHGLYQ